MLTVGMMSFFWCYVGVMFGGTWVHFNKKLFLSSNILPNCLSEFLVGLPVLSFFFLSAGLIDGQRWCAAAPRTCDSFWLNEQTLRAAGCWVFGAWVSTSAVLLALCVTFCLFPCFFVKLILTVALSVQDGKLLDYPARWRTSSQAPVTWNFSIALFVCLFASLFLSF